MGRLAWNPEADARGSRGMGSADLHAGPGFCEADGGHDDDLARGGGELHDAARAASSDGNRSRQLADAIMQYSPSITYPDLWLGYKVATHPLA